MRLKRIHARSLRGLPRTTPPLELREGGLVVLGPNGSGKSSIVDAIEMVLSERSTLFASNRRGVNWATAAPHVRHGAPDVALTLAHRGAEHSIRLGQEAPNEAVEAWLASAKTSTFVLRRHMLTNFISTEPASRYQALESFLQMGSFSAVEARAKLFLAQSEGQIVREQGAVDRVLEAARVPFQLAVRPTGEAEMFRLLDRLLEELGLTACRVPDEVAARIAMVREAVAALGLDATARGLLTLQAQLSTWALPAEVEVTREQMQVALREYRECRDLGLDEDEARVVLAGRALLERERGAHCPLCLQPIQLEDLLADLVGRSQAPQRVVAARQSLERHRDTLSSLNRLHGAQEW